MLLSKYKKCTIEKNIIIVICWYVFSELLINSFLPGSGWRVMALRLFGAKVGRNVVIKPYTKIKYPWKLTIGDHSWIGEGVWIDNLADVCIADNVCVSQGAYLCTGSHNWSSDTFDLIVSPISIGAHSWVCAKAVLGPGTKIGEGGVIGLGCVYTGRLEPWMIACAHVDAKIKPRRPGGSA